MDDEIGDILDSVSGPTDFSSPESTATDYQVLTRFWVAERSAPEVLPYPTALMDRMLDRVRKQISTIEDLTSTPANASSTANTNLTLSILQTDLSRTQFLIRSLLRQRLSKLTAHALYYLSLSPSPSSPERSSEASASPILSPSEHSFLHTQHALLASHYRDAFLNAFPPALQRLDDNAGGVIMVEGPDGKKAVFVRCLVGRWRGGISGGGALDEGEDDDEDEDARGGGGGRGEGHLNMRSGEVWVVRWEDVKTGVLAGKLEVL